ncbi:MAG: hypothetical protein H0W39_01105 [Sphingomonas sp.]|nr:hypothetical protein [Sphingomonas sp.]
MAKRKRDPIYPAMHPGGNIRAETVKMEMDDPKFTRDHAEGKLGNSRKIIADINIRESAITMLAAKGAITAPQAAAANRIRQLFEAMGGAGAGAMDYSRVVVDGGMSPDPISARQMQAGRDLKDAQKALKDAHGEYAYRLVLYICGEGYSIHDLCQTRRQRDTMTDCLRMYLDVLSELWGYAAKAR